MSTDAKRSRKPARPAKPLPEGIEVMVGRSQFAAAINRSPSRFDQLVNLGVVPKPDGTFQGDRFWLQSTVNRFIREQTDSGKTGDGRSV
jgi:hypothetical protein